MARIGRGHANGAVTVLNATATGIGCALAIAVPTTATWTWAASETGIRLAGGPDTRLVEAVAGGRAASVVVSCPFPPARGLKTSSSVAAALVRAAADADGVALSTDEVERRAVDACRRAGVTLTGALDDQVATVRGGCHLTDNRADRILASIPVPPLQVAVWVPDAGIPKGVVRAVDLAGARAGAREAEGLVRAGDLAGALTANGAAFHAAYADAGLPVDDLPVREALRAGALGAGLSGTGPAVSALFARRVPLSAVRGGTWTWTRIVPPLAPRVEVPA